MPSRAEAKCGQQYERERKGVYFVAFLG
jgi:hypothetical protein